MRRLHSKALGDNVSKVTEEAKSGSGYRQADSRA